MSSRIKSLDGLRGILCLLVVLHHYDTKYIPTSFYNNFLIRQADLLVDFFFIISGFVISYNYKNLDSIKDVGTFLKMRFLRLYPLLLFSTTVFFLFEIFSRNLFSDFINKEINNTSLFKSFIDTLLLNNASPLLGNTWGINRPTWSISAEFYAYIFFSICILLTKQHYKKYALSITFVCCAAMLYKIYSLDNYNNAEFGFIRCIYLFIMGMTIEKFKQHDHTLNTFWNIAIPVVSILILYFNMYFVETKTIHAFIELFLMPLFFSAIIYLAADNLSYTSTLFSKRPLQWLGKYSYSIYLNHAIILLTLPKLIFQVLKFNKSQLTEYIVLIICICITILYSLVTHKHIERKFYLKNQ